MFRSVGVLKNPKNPWGATSGPTPQLNYVVGRRISRCSCNHKKKSCTLLVVGVKMYIQNHLLCYLPVGDGLVYAWTFFPLC